MDLSIEYQKLAKISGVQYVHVSDKSRQSVMVLNSDKNSLTICSRGKLFGKARTKGPEDIFPCPCVSWPPPRAPHGLLGIGAMYTQTRAWKKTTVWSFDSVSFLVFLCYFWFMNFARLKRCNLTEGTNITLISSFMQWILNSYFVICVPKCYMEYTLLSFSQLCRRPWPTDGGTHMSPPSLG